MGRVSTLSRERLVALSRALPSESVSSRSTFQPTALTQSVEPRGSVSARFTPCRPKAINRASRAPQTWVECGPHPTLVSNGMWRNPIETHVCGRLNGFGGVSGRATDGGCVTERTRFTPAVNGGILSLIKDSNEQLVTNQLRRRNRSRFSGIFLAAHSIRQTRVERQSIKSMAQREPDRF